MVFQQPVLGQKSYLKHGSYIYIYILPSQTSCTILREIPSKLPATFLASSLIKYKPTQKMDGTPIYHFISPQKKHSKHSNANPDPNHQCMSQATEYRSCRPPNIWPHGNPWEAWTKKQMVSFKRPAGSLGISRFFFSPKRYYSSSSRYL